jgi:hypothetical protein
MDRFLSRFRSQITGVLSGFDRLVFRGTLIPLVRKGGMYAFLCRAGVRLLDFKDFVVKTSESIKQAALADAERDGRPVRYLESSQIKKEELVAQILAEHPVEQGLVCAFKTVEPCMSFEYHRSQDPNERGLMLRPKKCLHIYKYFVHPAFGLMGARIQTWFPFNIQVWLNGREWLAVQMKRKGIAFERHDNCFTRIDGIEAAQRLMDGQLEIDWTRALTGIARRLNPLHAKIFQQWPQDYYWSAYQAEWATDLLYKTPAALADIYPALVKHAMLNFSSEDVMRFLGRKLHGGFKGEVITSFKKRPEGVRVKHWAGGNSIKMYDKAGRDLRVETTTANTKTLPKVYRPLQDDPDGKMAWRPMRKGIADLHRRAEVSQRANERYLDALSVVDDSTPLSKIFDDVSQPIVKEGRRSRAIRVGDEKDIALLKAVSRGEFAVNGFRNRDLQRLLQPIRRDSSTQAKRKLSAKLGRQLRLLRTHGLVQRVPKSHYYRLTAKGQLLCAALSAARDTTTKQLLRNAA